MSSSAKMAAPLRKLRGFRIQIVGTGGQGVLTAARLLCNASAELGHDVTSGQLHGMSQRSGAVESSVLIDTGVSPVIACGQADFVVGFEPVETVRALPLMNSRTLVFMNTAPVTPYVLGQARVLNDGKNGKGTEYPELDRLVESIRAITPYLYFFDATELARQSGSTKVMNMIMLGCLLGFGSLPYSAEDFQSIVMDKAPDEFKLANKEAYLRGVELGRNFKLKQDES